jgi:hypothetical protein
MTIAVNSRPSWKDMYSAALFENDRTKISERILVAENEIVKRARVLFEVPGDNSDEAEALDDALYMLRALKSCLQLQTSDRLAA